MSNCDASVKNANGWVENGSIKPVSTDTTSCELIGGKGFSTKGTAGLIGTAGMSSTIYNWYHKNPPPITSTIKVINNRATFMPTADDDGVSLSTISFAGTSFFGSITTFCAFFSDSSNFGDFSTFFSFTGAFLAFSKSSRIVRIITVSSSSI